MDDEFRKRFTEELKSNFLSKHWIGDRLREFRQRAISDEAFKPLLKQEYITGLKKIEDGDQFPSWEALIVLILRECQSNLWRFFQAIETGQSTSPDVLIIPGYEPLYRLLTALIKEGLDTNDQYFIDGIKANLYGMYGDDKDLPEGVPPRNKRPLSDTPITRFPDPKEPTKTTVKERHIHSPPAGKSKEGKQRRRSR